MGLSPTVDIIFHIYIHTGATPDVHWLNDNSYPDNTDTYRRVNIDMCTSRNKCCLYMCTNIGGFSLRTPTHIYIYIRTYNYIYVYISRERLYINRNYIRSCCRSLMNVLWTRAQIYTHKEG